MEIMTFKGKKLNRKTKNKKFSILVAEKYEQQVRKNTEKKEKIE